MKQTSIPFNKNLEKYSSFSKCNSTKQIDLLSTDLPVYEGYRKKKN